MGCDSTLRSARNADLSRSYALTNLGVAYDLTGWTCAFNVYPSPGSAAILSLTGSPNPNQSSISISNASGGIFELFVSKTDLAALPVGSPTTSPALLYYDLLLISPASATTRAVFGSFIVDPLGGGIACDSDATDQVGLEIGGVDVQLQVVVGPPVIEGLALSGADIGALATANGAARTNLSNAVANQTSSGEFFTQNGGHAHRLWDRVLVAGAAVYDGSYNPTSADWLSTYIRSISGYTNLLSVQMAVLTDPGLTGGAGGEAFLAGAQTATQISAEAAGIGLFGVVVNNNAAYATEGWAGYFEAYHANATVASTYGVEIDTWSAVSTISPTPFQEGNVVALQLASGAFVAAGHDASAAIQIAANPNKFKVGINFMSTALTSGVAIALAAAASGSHSIEWMNAAGHGAGLITSVNTGSNANSLTFTNDGLQIAGADGSAVAFFNPLASGANWLTFGGNATGVAPYIAATGSDTNVDLELLTQGSGLVKFGSSSNFAANGSVATTLTSLGPTGSHTTVQKWLAVKDSAGATFYIPLF